jgi:hypothetical protein
MLWCVLHLSGSRYVSEKEFCALCKGVLTSVNGEVFNYYLSDPQLMNIDREPLCCLNQIKDFLVGRTRGPDGRGQEIEKDFVRKRIIYLTESVM